MLAGLRAGDNGTVDPRDRSIGKPVGNPVDFKGYPQIFTDNGRKLLNLIRGDSIIGLDSVLWERRTPKHVLGARSVLTAPF